VATAGSAEVPEGLACGSYFEKTSPQFKHSVVCNGWSNWHLGQRTAALISMVKTTRLKWEDENPWFTNDNHEVARAGCVYPGAPARFEGLR